MPKVITLAEVIAEVESSNDQFAIRYEPVVHLRFKNMDSDDDDYYILEDIMIRNNCNLSTACVLAAMSFGKYQIMGENLYDNQIKTTLNVVSYCGDEEAQDEAFERFIAGIGFTSDLPFFSISNEDRLKFATHYNGPGNPEAYVKAMNKAYVDLGVSTMK